MIKKIFFAIMIFASGYLSSMALLHYRRNILQKDASCNQEQTYCALKKGGEAFTGTITFDKMADGSYHKTQYHNGQKHGDELFFNANDKMMKKVIYHQGIEIITTTYREDGSISSEKIYDPTDVSDYTISEFYTNGNPKVIADYMGDTKSGAETVFNEKGEKLYQVIHIHISSKDNPKEALNDAINFNDLKALDFTGFIRIYKNKILVNEGEFKHGKRVDEEEFKMQNLSDVDMVNRLPTDELIKNAPSILDATKPMWER